MRCAVSSLLDAIEPWLLEALVPAASWALVRSLGTRLPPAFSGAILECRLARTDTRVDFMVCALQRDGGAAQLGALLGDCTSFCGPSAPLLHAWMRANSQLIATVPLAWLEYDLPASADPPEPVVFLCVDPDFPDSRLAPAPEAAALCALTDSVLSIVRGRAEPQVTASLRRCVEALPLGARLLHLAPLQARGRNGVRLMIAMPLLSVQPFLEAVSWPGQAAARDAVFALCGTLSGLVGLQLDVWDGIGPYFALECYEPSSLSKNRAEPAMKGFITHLIDGSICAPEKGEAALLWSGQKTLELPGAAWLVNIQRRMYVKLAAHSDGRIEAKTYLSFSPTYSLI